MMDCGRIPLIVAVPLAILLATGCGGSEPSGPGEPEDRGTQLASFSDPPPVKYPGELAWTRDGEALVFIHHGLQKVQVSTQAMTELYASPSITTLARAEAAERFYFGAFIDRPVGQANFEISRVHPTTAASEALFHVFPTSFDIIAVSPGETHLAIARRLYDLQSGAYTDLPPGVPYGFSPDGSRILYWLSPAGTSSIGSPALITTADGSSQPLHGTGDHYLLHRWEGNTPHFLDAAMNFGTNTRTVTLTEINGITGATRQIAQLSTTDNYLGAGQAAWSPDGETLAVWIEQQDRTKLYLVRTGAAPTIAANVTGAPGAPVFAPSGTSIAYPLRVTGRVYLYLK